MEKEKKERIRLFPETPEGFNSVERVTEKCLLYLSLLPVLAAAFLMCLTVVDVAKRTIVGAPIPGVMDYSELMMVIICYGAMPWITWRSGHIKIDILVSKLPKFFQRVSMVVNMIASGAFCAFMGYQMYNQSIVAKNFHYVTASGNILKYPFYIFGSIMLLITVWAFLLNLIHIFRTGSEVAEL